MAVFSGVYAAATTPRRRGLEEVDLGGLWALIDFLGSKKVDGIVLMGSTGEFVHFTMEERLRMMPLAVKRSRVPILINVSHSTLDCAVQLAQTALRSGAAGLLIMPPYYFRYDQQDIRSFFLCFLKEVGTRVPVLLYNIPCFTSPIDPAAAASLMTSGYAGIKDSSGDYGNFVAVRAAAGSDSTFLVGSDALFARTRLAGADGVVSGSAAAIPELLVALDRALKSGNQDRAARLDARLQEFVARLDGFPVPVAVKEAANVRGLKTGEAAVPLDGEKADRLHEFREWFQGWLPAVERECAGA